MRGLFLNGCRGAGTGRRFFRCPKFGSSFFSACSAGDTSADLQGHIIIERARVRLLVGDAQHREQVEDHRGLHLKLPRQLVDSDLTHNKFARAGKRLLRRR
jgi:hypothetical protein